ncbi:MAG: glycosyltransferase family 4 protein [Promethearchaeota archaeon]
MKKLVFISNIAAPYQVKFCYELRKYFDCEFWFHEYLNKMRPIWWKIELGEKCNILKNVLFKKSGKYLSLNIIHDLMKFNPDILILGGFSIPTNLAAYYWAKIFNKKVVVFTEISRRVLKKKVAGLIGKKIIKFLYKDIDGIFTHSQDATSQFKHEFGFGNKVFTAQYPADIDTHLKHSLRESKKYYTYLFANRLTEIYNPLLAIEIFNQIKNKYPGSKFLMNASGELLDSCKSKIKKLNLNDDVGFLDNIQSWNDLHKFYQKSDILIFPAIFSAGNFTIIEAMASGMGIIISNKILGSGKYIKNGKNGFVCEPNVNDFIKCVDIYISNPELLKVHGRINKEIVKKYSIAETAILFKNLLERL